MSSNTSVASSANSVATMSNQVLSFYMLRMNSNIVASDGYYNIIQSSNDPPNAISGTFHKMGHVVKNWKPRYFIVAGGELVYYKASTSSGEMTQKGTISLKGYFVTEESGDIYLSCPSDPDAKDLHLRFTQVPGENKFNISVWIYAIRSHIRYAHGTYSNISNWVRLTFEKPALQLVQQICPDKDIPIHYGVEEDSKPNGIIKPYEIVEVSDILINSLNNTRGRLIDGRGYVTIGSFEGRVNFIEIPQDEQIEALARESERSRVTDISVERFLRDYVPPAHIQFTRK